MPDAEVAQGQDDAGDSPDLGLVYLPPLCHLVSPAAGESFPPFPLSSQGQGPRQLPCHNPLAASFPPSTLSSQAPLHSSPPSLSK